jgi:FkbM family methyltransferase
MGKLRDLAKKLPVVPTVYRKVRDRRWANRVPVATPFGFSIVAGDEMQRGEFEAEDTKRFRALTAGVDVVVDVGANIGYYCLHALSMKKRLIAFEPMPLNIEVLLKNIRLNGWSDNAEVFPMALSDKPGILEIYGSGTGASLIKGWAGFSPRASMLVPVSSLDLVLGNQLAGSNVFILIDVEGAEYGLLKGAQQLLNSDPKPIWMVEIAYGVNQPEGRSVNPNYVATFELFWDAGYDAYCADESAKLRRCDPAEVRKDPAGAEKRARSNFFFVHRTSRDVQEKMADL